MKSSSCLHLYRSFLILLRFYSVSRATSVLRLSTLCVFFRSISRRYLKASCSCFCCSSCLSCILPYSTSFLIWMTLLDSNPSTSFFAYTLNSPSFCSRALSTLTKSCSSWKLKLTEFTISVNTSLKDSDGKAF